MYLKKPAVILMNWKSTKVNPIITANVVIVVAANVVAANVVAARR